MKDVFRFNRFIILCFIINFFFVGGIAVSVMQYVIGILLFDALIFALAYNSQSKFFWKKES